MAQLLRNTGHVCTACDGNAGKSVAKFVGMKAWNSITLGEFLHIPGRGLRVHGFRAAGLGKDIGADGLVGLLPPEFMEQTNDLGINVYCPDLAAFGSVQINALLRGILAKGLARLKATKTESQSYDRQRFLVEIQKVEDEILSG